MTATKVLVTGASGFIGGYLVQQLLDREYEVVGVDDHSKYGRVQHSYDDHPNYQLVEGDARDEKLLFELLADCDHLVAGAALIGGIRLLPRVRLRPARRQRAHRGRDLRRGDPGPAGGWGVCAR